MDSNRLEQLGRRWWGDSWQTRLAATIGVTSRTVRRWIAGDVRIPPPTAWLIEIVCTDDVEGAVAEVIQRREAEGAPKEPKRRKPLRRPPGGRREAKGKKRGEAALS